MTRRAWGVSLATWCISQSSVGCEMQKHSSHWPQTEKEIGCGAYYPYPRKPMVGEWKNEMGRGKKSMKDTHQAGYGVGKCSLPTCSKLWVRT